MAKIRTERCIVCGQKKTAGIRIFSSLICLECESEIVKTDVLDDKYPYFIHKLRTIWYKKDA